MNFEQQRLYKQRKTVDQQSDLIDERIRNGLCPQCGKPGIYEKNLAGVLVKLCEDHF